MTSTSLMWRIHAPRAASRLNANQSGVVFFPGSAPLYRNGVMVGGLGVSGDGVEQDDYVTAGGAAGLRAAGTDSRRPDLHSRRPAAVFQVPKKPGAVRAAGRAHGLLQAVHRQIVVRRTRSRPGSSVALKGLGISGGANKDLPVGDRRRIEPRQEAKAILGVGEPWTLGPDFATVP